MIIGNKRSTADMMTDLPHKSLVMVVGAGASKEVGLPLGRELAKQIGAALAWQETDHGLNWTGDRKVRAALDELGKQAGIDRIFRAAKGIQEGMELASSIDSFIHIHRADPWIASCGKIAIAQCVLRAEAASNLRVDRSNIYNTINFANVDATWYAAFVRMLTDGSSKSELPARLKQVTLVVFNYDRCIEHYLHGALQRIYRESSSWATEVLKSLDIYHPYGMVGGLPWMAEKTSIDFGESPHSTVLMELSQQLLTFTESVNADKSDIECIRRDIRGASRIAFLGFAFHKLNLDLLIEGHATIEEGQNRKIYGTALGLSEDDVMVLSSDIPARTNRQIRDVCKFGRELTCAKLFHEYRLSLSLT